MIMGSCRGLPNVSVSGKECTTIAAIIVENGVRKSL